MLALTPAVPADPPAGGGNPRPWREDDGAAEAAAQPPGHVLPGPPGESGETLRRHHSGASLPFNLDLVDLSPAPFPLTSHLCVAAVFAHREEEEPRGLRGDAVHPVLHPAPHVHHLHRLQHLLWPLQRLRLLRQPRPLRVSGRTTR